jgi:hypothetical protein
MRIQIYQSEAAQREWVETFRRLTNEAPGNTVRWESLFGSCEVDKGTALRFLAHVDAGGSPDLPSFLCREMSEWSDGASVDTSATLPF